MKTKGFLLVVAFATLLFAICSLFSCSSERENLDDILGQRDSSSSVVPSSSSALLSSSSEEPSKCAGFVNGTERLHYNKMCSLCQELIQNCATMAQTSQFTYWRSEIKCGSYGYSCGRLMEYDYEFAGWG